jgi:hypothetical protein
MIRFEVSDKPFITLHQYPVTLVRRETLKKFLGMLSHFSTIFLMEKLKTQCRQQGDICLIFKHGLLKSL